MTNPDSASGNSDFQTNPYAVATARADGVERLSWLQWAIVGGLSGSVSLLVLALLLTVVGLVVTVLYETPFASRETTSVLITALLAGGIFLSLGGSVLAGTRSFQKLQRIFHTLSRPTAAHVELEKQVAAILKNRRPP